MHRNNGESTDHWSSSFPGTKDFVHARTHIGNIGQKWFFVGTISKIMRFVIKNGLKRFWSDRLMVRMFISHWYLEREWFHRPELAVFIDLEQPFDCNLSAGWWYVYCVHMALVDLIEIGKSQNLMITFFSAPKEFFLGWECLGHGIWY